MESPLVINNESDETVFDVFYDLLEKQMEKVRLFYDEMKDMYFEEYMMYLHKIRVFGFE